MLAFGAGALISAVSFDLAQEGAEVGDTGFLGLGLAVGAVTYFALNRIVGRRSRRADDSGAEESDGSALALGAFLDGIPEQAVLGIGIAVGDGVSVGLLAAIFVSNLPEAIGASSEMRAAGTSAAAIRRLWLAVAVICILATVAGYATADNVSGNLNAAVDGFAAGALLVMLIDSMIPEAVRKGGDVSGLVTVLGFAVAAALSSVSDCRLRQQDSAPGPSGVFIRFGRCGCRAAGRCCTRTPALANREERVHGDERRAVGPA